ELGHILVVGDLAGDQVVVLVHRVAEGVQDVGPDDHAVGAGQGQGGELDVELGVVGVGDHLDAGDRDLVAVGAGEADHLVGGDAGAVQRRVEGDPDVCHAAGEVVFAGGGVGGDPRPLDGEVSGVLVAGHLAGDAVAVLVHLVALHVLDVRADHHTVYAHR